MWIFSLMRHHVEHTWVDRKTVEVRVIQTLIEPIKLSDESQVWIRTLSPLFHSLVSLIEVDPFCKDHVRNADS